jgi:FkbM family methyltransferase
MLIRILRRLASARAGAGLVVMSANVYLGILKRLHRIRVRTNPIVFGGTFDGFTVFDRYIFDFTKSELLAGPYAHYDVPSELWYRLYQPKHGDVIVDVGAHIGTDTLCFCRSVGPTGRVISIESHPRITKLLELNVLENAFSNVKIVNCAVSDVSGSVTVDFHDISVGATVFQGDVSVPCDSLDNLLADVPEIDFLKMNIEGYERFAIRGGRNVLHRTRYVAIACHDFLNASGENEFYTTLTDCKLFLQELGFEVEQQVDSDRPWVACHLHAVNPKLNHVTTP